jgi:hypothetical protein
MGVAALVSLLASGCVYFGSTYVPSASDGKVYDDLIRDPDLSLDRGNAHLEFTAHRRKDRKTTIVLVVEALTRKSSHSDSSPAISFAFKKSNGGPSVAVQYPDAIVQSVEMERGTYGVTRVAESHAASATFDAVTLAEHDYAVFRVEAPTTDSYLVKWPDVIVDGREYELPPVKFVWKRKLRAFVIND